MPPSRASVSQTAKVRELVKMGIDHPDVLQVCKYQQLTGAVFGPR